jgi:ATP-dependent helicase HrpA
MRHAAQHVTENQFPEWLELEDGKLRLKYRFEPKHPLDGVTMDVPLAILNRLQPAPFEWLVPGMIRDKLQQLIKGLPKQVRRCCVPVPDFVTRFLSSNPDLQQPIAAQLARFILRETGGVKVDIDEFNKQELPEHLLFNFRIIDDGKQEIGLGRDLLALQKQFGQAAQLTFRDSSADFERDEVSSWDFGDLPESIQFARGRQQLTGYPALTLEQDKVAIRLFDTQPEAERHHRAGVIRLLQLQLKEQMKQLGKGLSGMTQIGLNLRNVANVECCWPMPLPASATVPLLAKTRCRAAKKPSTIRKPRPHPPAGSDSGGHPVFEPDRQRIHGAVYQIAETPAGQ